MLGAGSRGLLLVTVKTDQAGIGGFSDVQE